MPKLVIVESPTKAKTIGQFLGSGYTVTSSFGHIRDLPKSRLGIDTENDFEPEYVIPTAARKTVTTLKREAKRSDAVILATDEDREGEAIAWHLTQALGLENPKSEIQNPKRRKVERIVFHEITRGAIEEALKHPRTIDEHLVDAQQARRIIDRLVGYKLSPFLWKKVARGLSAGRVQSVALRLIVDRENEIRNFTREEYWTVTGAFEKAAGGGTIEANLVEMNGTAIEKFGIKTQEQAEAIVRDLASCRSRVKNIEQKEVRRNPLPPFTTSTLQQEAARRLRFSSRKTMLLAQHLYENGHITYMRTDSVNLSSESTEAARRWLEGSLGKQYALDQPRAFKTKSKLAQEAHEAIRPTEVTKTPDTITLEDAGERKVYELIWRRFVASQMPQALLDSTSVVIETEGKVRYGFRATGMVMRFDGFLKVWPHKFEERVLPELTAQEEVVLIEAKPEQHFTEPPPRYSEATLIKTLEEYGIGRPSTYAPTISVIQARRYVVKEEGRFKPTDIGELVNKVLTENFEKIVDVGFTAAMEDELDNIAAGRADWRNTIGNFYRPFAEQLAAKYEEVSKKALTEEKTDEVCELCGKPMVIKMGRFGRFLACSGFPECKNTKRIAGAGGTNEPPKRTGIPCPTCREGEIVERRVRKGRARGKRFWGCSRYPQCTFASWNDPSKENAESSPGTEDAGAPSDTRP